MSSATGRIALGQHYVTSSFEFVENTGQAEDEW